MNGIVYYLILNKLKFSYSSPDRHQTAEITKEILKNCLHVGHDGIETLYNAFFRYCIEWLARPDVYLLESQEIKAKFDEWRGRYLLLRQWLGISSAYQIKMITSIQEHDIPIPSDLCLNIDVFIQSQKRGLILYGERGLGKSTAILKYIRKNQILDSDYLMININEVLNSFSSNDPVNSFKFFSTCKMIVIDNCENLENYPASTIDRFKKLIVNSPINIKFTFIFKYISFELNDNSTVFGLEKKLLEVVPMKPLDKAVVKLIFPSIYASLFGDIKFTLYPRKSSNSLIQKLACYPFYLNLLVKFHGKNQGFNFNFSSTENFIDDLLQSLLNPSQLSVARKLVYAISQSKTTNSFISEIKGEISDIIIIENNNCQFSHKLYEEWAVRLVIDARLKIMIDSNDSIPQIYQEIIRVLPLHHKEIYIYLNKNILLRDYINTNSFSSNNAHFINILLESKNYNLMSKIPEIFYVLADSDPEALLPLLLEISKIHYFRQKLILKNGLLNEFGVLFCTTLIRSFCISKNLNITGKLFFDIVNSLESINEIFSNYMDNIFIDAFAASQSMGLMSLEHKLSFLKHQFSLISAASTMEQQCYFQYIYRASVKAASPGEGGNASYAENRCFFNNSHGYLDGYVNYEGRHFPFSGSTPQEEANYHSSAIEILVDYYNTPKEIITIDQAEVLRAIKNIFKINIAAVTCNYVTNELYIIDVASKIVSKIYIDEKLYNYFIEKIISKENEIQKNYLPENAELSEQRKAISYTFNPQKTYDLMSRQITTLKDILGWRVENTYQVYNDEFPAFLYTIRDPTKSYNETDEVNVQKHATLGFSN